MEVPPTPDQRPSGPLSGDQGPSGPLSGENDLAWRMAHVESRLEAISERLGRIESSLREAVAQEVRGATTELRRAISELGRRLVQDLPHELARHRDAIVAELRPAPPPPPPAFEEPDQEVDADIVEMPEPAVAPVPDTPETAPRRRASRVRRRHG